MPFQLTLITIGLAVMAILFGLWRHARSRLSQAHARIEATETELAIARRTLAERNAQIERYQGARRGINRQREYAEATIVSAPDTEDGPMAPVLADTLERHRARQETNGVSGHSINSGGFDSSDAGGVSDGGGL